MSIEAFNAACDSIESHFDKTHARIAALESALNSCLEYLDNYVDVVDGDYGEPAPNKAMSLVQEINEALGLTP